MPTPPIHKYMYKGWQNLKRVSCYKDHTGSGLSYNWLVHVMVKLRRHKFTNCKKIMREYNNNLDDNFDSFGGEGVKHGTDLAVTKND